MAPRTCRSAGAAAALVAASVLAGQPVTAEAASGAITVAGSSVASVRVAVEPFAVPRVADGPLLALGTVTVRANAPWVVTAVTHEPGALVLLAPLAGTAGPAATVIGGPTPSTVLVISSDRADVLAGATFTVTPAADGAVPG